MYPAQVDLIDDVLPRERIQTFFLQPLKGDLIGGGMDFAIDLVAPAISLSAMVLIF